MLNEYNAMGRLTAAPNYTQTTTGTARCTFIIAVDRPKDKNGQQQQAVFVPCIAWGNTASMISQHFGKGKPIIINGYLQNNNYTDSNGIMHYQMQVVISKVSFVLSDSSTGYNNNSNQGYSYNQSSNPASANNYANSNYQFQPSQTQQQFTPLPNENIEINEEEYEKIINDGDIPF